MAIGSAPPLLQRARLVRLPEEPVREIETAREAPRIEALPWVVGALGLAAFLSGVCFAGCGLRIFRARADFEAA